MNWTLPDLPAPIQAPERIFVAPIEATEAFVPAPLQQSTFAPIVQGIASAVVMITLNYRVIMAQYRRAAQSRGYKPRQVDQGNIQRMREESDRTARNMRNVQRWRFPIGGDLSHNKKKTKPLQGGWRKNYQSYWKLT